MADTTVQALSDTVQKTQGWLKELAAEGPFENEEQAYSAMRAVLHSLRDRLIADEAVHLAAQLPMLVRGFYYEGWRPAQAPNEEDTPEQFFRSVDESLRNARFTLDAEQSTRAVFALLERHIDAGQLRQVRHQLPEEMQELWNAPANAG